MPETLRVLHIEDDLADAMLLQHALHDAGAHDIELEVVRTLREARFKMARGGYDLVILDLRLPDSVSPVDTLRTAEKHANGTPLMILTGSAGVDAETVGLHINLLDKNEFFHGKDPRRSHRLLALVRDAADDALHI
ncbi:response regulator [Marinicauda algicola]|uniref:Response regulator n=1 Tax=Marinicauda algicola TaxID=2029849 RepID=A0A4V3RY54_9PROT|nr:response regulator [Marinicauda algicola]TGY88859.1 response regulator [Marinicauda algicola]